MERRAGREGETGPELIGDSPVWRAFVARLPRVATSGLPVLLLGETGSGKELVARALHAWSSRSRAAFVAQNCGATPDTLIESELFGHARGAFTGAVGERPGLFEEAEGGTLLLDEVGDASPLLQMKLLRVLQEGEARRVGDTRSRRVDVRIVAATHQPVEQAVARGAFRADLFFRLAAVRLRVPALRERGADVVLLARHFLARAAARTGGPTPEPTPALRERWARHRWPGNVRELAHACAYAVLVAGARGRVDVEHWPEPLLLEPTDAAGDLHAETRALERRRLAEALVRTHGNRTAAARALGLSRQGFLQKMRRHGLDARATLDDGGVAV